MLSLFAWLLAGLYPVATAKAQGWDTGVVKLLVTKHDGTERIGSGFIARLDGDWAYIVTAHVVQGGRETAILFSQRPLAAPTPAQVVH